MCRFCDIEEKLWVSAPELIFTTLLVDTTTASSVLVPTGLLLELNSPGQLHKFDRVRSEDTKEEGSLVRLLNGFIFDVRHNNVVDGLVFVGWVQPQCARDFSLFEALQTLCSLKLNVVTVDLPKTVSL